MKELFAAAALAVSTAFATLPEVSDVTMDQDPASRRVTVTYRLSATPAVVTVDVQTNGTSIGDANLHYFDGAVNRVVTAADADGEGLYTVTWRPDKAWTGHKITDGSVTAVVKAWPTDAPPDIMVVNLAATGDVRYYTSTNALPGGLDSDAYRTQFLVLKRIHSTDVPWRMGTLSDTTQRQANQNSHYVTLDHDYYIGIFEFTYGQWETLGFSMPEHGHITDANYRAYPVAQFLPIWIRVAGNMDGSWSADYDGENDPHPDSAIGKLRTVSGGLKFELPTEAEWECAARAGHDSDDVWGNGAAITTANRALYVWSGSKSTSARVGSFPPNDFGLYDMAGNSAELCRDVYQETLTAADGAPNLAAGEDDKFTFRDGGFDGASLYDTRPSRRFGSTRTLRWKSYSFRVALPLK